MGQKLGTSIVTLLFLGAMFGGLFHMAGMEMSGGMTTVHTCLNKKQFVL